MSTFTVVVVMAVCFAPFLGCVIGWFITDWR